MPNKKWKISDRAIDPSMRRSRQEMQLYKLQPSNLENIDAAMFEWINEKLNIHCTTNSGWEKVPVIWASAERAFQTKRSQTKRDSDGALIFPIITIERTSVSKELTRKGIYYGNIPGVDDYRNASIEISKRIQHDKTANFANADSAKRHGVVSSPVGHGQVNFRTRKNNNKIVYETFSIPMPVYLDINYQFKIRAEFQQQMNEIVQPLMVYPGGLNYFVVERNEHRYECFVQSEFSQENNLSSMGEESRKYETQIDIKTLGYVFGSENNQESPKVTRRENIVEFRIQRERVIMEDSPEFIDIKRGKYRR